MGMGAIVAALLAVIILAAFIAAYFYNQLVVLRNRSVNAFAQIDVQLRRRYDLIPNMVSAVQAYMQHERATLTELTEARSRALAAAGTARPAAANGLTELTGAEQLLQGALGRFTAVVERYPDLKASTNVARLMEDLATTENRIAFARQAYNDAVTVYNTAGETFPALLFARALGFARAQLFELDNAAAREAPQIALN